MMPSRRTMLRCSAVAWTVVLLTAQAGLAQVAIEPIDDPRGAGSRPSNTQDLATGPNLDLGFLFQAEAGTQSIAKPEKHTQERPPAKTNSSP